MDDAFVRVVIGIYEERPPIFWQRFRVHRKTVILWSDVAQRGSQVDHGLIHSTIPKFHLVRFCPCCKSKKLVSETNTENRLWVLLIDSDSKIIDGLLSHSWITRSIRDEEAIIFVLIKIVIPGNDFQMNLSFMDKVSNDVILDPTINCNNCHIRSFVQLENILSGNRSDKVSLVWIFERDYIISELNFAQHRSLVSNYFGELSCID
mmetsp:Transcript_1126/g.1557  ORF Transcript_1126/g.1557 Transcript_1126/m.1557 type:complete len:206 (+) Transcript_1126:3542-4159(+)